jgi:thiamine monophosphate synthase
MNAYKNFKDDALTADWLREVGLDDKTFSTTHIKLLQAQQAAQALLNQHISLLTATQIQKLKIFQCKMTYKKTRTKLKPEHAYPILNISAKINRQLFKSYRALDQQSITSSNTLPSPIPIHLKI